MKAKIWFRAQGQRAAEHKIPYRDACVLCGMTRDLPIWALNAFNVGFWDTLHWTAMNLKK